MEEVDNGDSESFSGCELRSENCCIGGYDFRNGNRDELSGKWKINTCECTLDFQRGRR
jgi:hypothetical protein